MKVARRIILFLLPLVLIIVGFLLWSHWGKRYQLVLSEKQLIEKLSAKFPFEKTYLFVLQLRLSEPELQLEEGSDRIAFGCTVETNIKIDVDSEKIPGPLRGKAKLSGLLRYEAADGEFFLHDARVEDLDVAGIPEKWRGKVRDAASKAVEEYLNRAPVYKLRPTDFKKAAARLVLQDVKVVQKSLIVTMGLG